MFFQQRTNSDASISYFFGWASHRKAVAVDVVGGDEAWFAETARKIDVLITHVIDTHGAGHQAAWDSRCLCRTCGCGAERCFDAVGNARANARRNPTTGSNSSDGPSLRPPSMDEGDPRRLRH